ncbi:MAG: hypothetical protein NTV68_10555 [Methanomicrobiales archaeon]|nr:hypothetical protein [Methanomicrobiales archaeon]
MNGINKAGLSCSNDKARVPSVIEAGATGCATRPAIMSGKTSALLTARPPRTFGVPLREQRDIPR